MKTFVYSVLLVGCAIVLSGCGSNTTADSVFDNTTNLYSNDTAQTSDQDNPLMVEDTPSDGSAQVVDMDTPTTPDASSVVLKTSMGDISIELYPQDAPKTVENFLKLAQSDFYNGVTFHRVIPDFMIQGGDPLSKNDNPNDDGTGGPGYFFEDEINDHKIVYGSLAMANAGPNTNGSQFFIVTADATPWLDGKHTVFGKVTSGMDVVEAIQSVERDGRDRPLTNVFINSVSIVE